MRPVARRACLLLLPVTLLLLVTPVTALAARPDRAQSGELAARHVVEPGQTVWSIAHASGTTVEDLLSRNGMSDPAELRAGQVLRLPAPLPEMAGGIAAAAPAGTEPIVAIPQPSAVLPAISWPVHGRLTSLYGRRKRALHSGIDIAAIPGTIVTAAASGRVVRSGSGWGRYGKVILLDHGNGWSTLYAHAARLFVKEGDTVLFGQAIAAVGRTGNATGPHLHFEVWEGDRTVDPLKLLAAPEDDRSASLEH